LYFSSPKNHARPVGVFREVSVNATVNGAIPEAGVPVKPMVGAAPGEVTTVVSGPADPVTPILLSLLSANTGRIPISTHIATTTQIRKIPPLLESDFMRTNTT
jgi:hypothetical protein